MPLPGEREGNGNGFRLVVKGLVKGHIPASFDLQVRVCKGGAWNASSSSSSVGRRVEDLVGRSLTILQGDWLLMAGQVFWEENTVLIPQVIEYLIHILIIRY